MSTEFNLSRIDKTRFRPAAEVEDVLKELSRNLVVGEKFRVARLAIARSLAEDTPIDLLPKGTEPGTSIEGQHLFGDDTNIWACLLTEAGTVVSSAEEFKSLVEAHWTRGARLLYQDLEKADMQSAQFMSTLAALAKQRENTGENAAGGIGGVIPQISGAVTVKVGEISTNLKNNEPVSFVLNAPGVSPHISVLGKTRSGKTRTGSFDLATKVGGGRHINPYSPYVRLAGESCQLGYASTAVQSIRSSLKRGGLFLQKSVTRRRSSRKILAPVPGFRSLQLPAFQRFRWNIVGLVVSFRWRLHHVHYAYSPIRSVPRAGAGMGFV